MVIDKTGTITEGKPSVEKVVTLSHRFTKLDLLQKIASLNQYGEHPLAHAVVIYAKEKQTKLIPVADFEAVSGKGVIGTVANSRVLLGNRPLLEQFAIEMTGDVRQEIQAEQALGKTLSYIAVDQELVGYVAISDAIKESSSRAIKSLQQAGIEVIMLTGDNKLTAQADIGIAMGTGTDVAIESAGITLVKGDLQGIVKARHLSVEVMINIKQNLFFAFIYNILGVPVAAGMLYPFGILLSPMIAALAMSFSFVSVIANALRLNTTTL